MADLKITQEQKDRRVSFGKVGAKTIGELSQPELLELAIIARNSGNPLLLVCFDGLPEIADLLKTKADGELKAANVIPPAKEVKDSKDK